MTSSPPLPPASATCATRWRPERIAALAAAALAASAPAAGAYGPDATAAEAVAGSIGAVLGQGNFIALVLAGLWLGFLPTGRPGRAALVVLAAVAAGTLVGWTWRPPARLDALIAASGLVIALLLVAGHDRSNPLATLPAAAAIGLFGIGLGGTLRLDAAPAAYVAAFVATYTLAVVAFVAGGFAAARLLRGRGGPRLPRMVGAWAGAVAALMLALGLMPRTPAFEAAEIDLRVDAPRLEGPALHALVEGLLARVYLAFEEQTEEGIFDALAAVTDGDVLIELYLQRRQALELEATGGGRSELTGIRLDTLAEKSPPPATGHHVYGAWEVVGSFGHWGHVHERANRYEADLVLTPVEGTWRITGFALHDMVRLEPETLPDPAETLPDPAP